MSASEEFDQLQIHFTDPLQHEYEVIRPIVLFSQRVTERAQELGLDRTQVGEQARRFVEQGMEGLGDQRRDNAGRPSQALPISVQAYLLSLRRRYPPLHYREMVRIVYHKFGCQTHHHAVKSFLDQNPLEVTLDLPLTHFHQFQDAYRARWAVVRMYFEGWNYNSIAGALHLSERHVRRLVQAFTEDGFEGLEDHRTRPPDHPANQLTLAFEEEVLELQQEYPRAGRFRIRGLWKKQHPEQEPPSERTVGRALAHNRQEHDAPGPWSSKRDDTPADPTVKEIPFPPKYPHHRWFIDFRHLVQRDGHWVYSLCLLEGFSRQILAGMATPYSDLTAVLQLLHAAMSEYGLPEEIISDNAQVFYAQDYRDILQALQVQPQHIAKGRPWQNLIEGQFKIQLRLADFKFEHAASVSEIQTLHDEFVQTFNTTQHGAHQDRQDGCETPAQVLAGARGRLSEQERLRRLFQQVRFTRTVNRYGLVRIQRFFIYAERGLARQRVAIWIYEGHLRIEHQQLLLAQYQCRYHERDQELQDVSAPTLYATAFRSPQLELFELTEAQWTKVYQRVLRQREKRASRVSTQLRLFDPALVSLLGLFLGTG